MNLKVIANLSTECKVFFKILPILSTLSLKGNQTALICMKNMAHCLDETQQREYQKVVDFEFLKDITSTNSEASLLLLA